MRRELREILRTLRRAVARIGIERAPGSQLLDLVRRAARPRPAEAEPSLAARQAQHALR